MVTRRKSAADLKISGTFRKSRHASREIPVVPSDPKPGEKLPAPVLKVRAELVSILRGRLTEADGLALDELAERATELRRLREAIRKSKPGSLEYTRINSALTTAAAALDRLSREFGLTPLSRAGLPVESGETKPKVAIRRLTKLDSNGATH